MLYVNIYVFKADKRGNEELDGPAVSALGVRSQNLSNVRIGQSSDG
jgi:hypothetical protein